MQRQEGWRVETGGLKGRGRSAEGLGWRQQGWKVETGGLKDRGSRAEGQRQKH